MVTKRRFAPAATPRAATARAAALSAGLVLAAVLVFLSASRTAPSVAQVPTATTSATTTPVLTPSASPVATTLPPPDLTGEWSITRSWWRWCPGCGGGAVVRTTPWVLTQVGATVRIDRGPRGSLTSVAGGGAYLTLEGLENDPSGLFRFWYGTLFVSPDGLTFEGAFNGSERIANPCAPEPPILSCSASAGYLRAYRVAGRITPSATSPPASPATPPLGETSTPPETPSATAAPTRTPPPPVPSATPTATASATPRPPAPAWLPRVIR